MNILSHLVFSSRYVFILAPMIVFPGLNPISMYLPNLELLSFRVVFALPIAYVEDNNNVYKKCYFTRVNICRLPLNLKTIKGCHNKVICAFTVLSSNLTVITLSDSYPSHLSPPHLITHLHDRIRGQHTFFSLSLSLSTSYCSKVPHSIFSRHRFTSARLSTHDQRLVCTKTT